MTLIKHALVLTLMAGTVAASGITVQAAQADLPILVDKYYELKNPSGPVTAVLVPEELKRPQILYEVPNMDIEDIPNPQWEQQVVMQR